MLKSKDLLEKEKKDILQKMNEAVNNGKFEEYSTLFMQYNEKANEIVMQKFQELESEKDTGVLQARGVRCLTQKEKKYYEELTAAMKAPDFKQALTNTSIIMPETIIDDVFKNLVDEHPLLNYIDFKNTSILTKWFLNDHSIETGVWGDVTDAITKELSSAFKEIKLDQYKLSAFFILDNSMLDLGPEWIDSYVRMCLSDAISCGLEKSIVTGDGNKCPIGMDRDIHEGVSVTGGVYPRKTMISVKSFTPVEYGAILAKLAKTEKGKSRKFDKVLLICNQFEYLTKVMPASTILNSAGAYINNLFPFPTEVVVSNELADGEAIVTLPKEYFLGVGFGTIGGKIEYSDDVKFLEDKRAYKAKMYGSGRNSDNTCSLLLDISKLDPAYITVKNVQEQTAPASK